MKRPLAGQVVLITGAARGIGAATAQLLASRGARLALIGLEPQRLAALCAELGGEHVWFECDVTDRNDLEQAVAGTIDAFGGIDVFVANAGIASRGTIAVCDVDALVRTVEVNLIGVIRTTAATVEQLIASRGYLLLISSAAAFAALPGMATYAASKSGVEQFGNGVRLELAHLGVRVGTAHPGWIDTDLVRDAIDDLPAFRQAMGKLPWPVRSTTSVEACAAAIVNGVRRRRRRIHVPRGIGLLHALRPVLTSPLADWVVRRGARTAVPTMEAQVRVLGRPFGRHCAPGRTQPSDAHSVDRTGH